MPQKNVDYSTIAGDFVGLNLDVGCPVISTSSSKTPVAIVLEKLDDMYDPFIDTDVSRTHKDTYMVRVQISGIASVKFSGNLPTVGDYVQLGPNGKGGVKTVESGGRSYLVVGANVSTNKIWIVL